MSKTMPGIDIMRSEGYETLLNTDLAQEEAHFARFLTLVAEHKHKIGFPGTLLIEPKPHEPTKHQYDYDCATVHGFLARHGLDTEYRLNIEANHATLAGHSVRNGFAQIKYDPTATSCTSLPAAFHPAYSTSSEDTRVPVDRALIQRSFLGRDWPFRVLQHGESDRHLAQRGFDLVRRAARQPVPEHVLRAVVRLLRGVLVSG